MVSTNIISGAIWIDSLVDLQHGPVTVVEPWKHHQCLWVWMFAGSSFKHLGMYILVLCICMPT